MQDLEKMNTPVPDPGPVPPAGRDARQPEKKD
jgi:hypothetical protein